MCCRSQERRPRTRQAGSPKTARLEIFEPVALAITILRKPEWRLYSRTRLLFFSLSANAAALILAACIAADPPEAVMQPRPGIDIQVGHNRLVGLVGRNFGISPFDSGILSLKPRNHRARNQTAIQSPRAERWPRQWEQPGVSRTLDSC